MNLSCIHALSFYYNATKECNCLQTKAVWKNKTNNINNNFIHSYIYNFIIVFMNRREEEKNEQFESGDSCNPKVSWSPDLSCL